MDVQDTFSEDDPAYEAEPEPWRPPAHCPQCLGNQTRFLTTEDEMSVYKCDVCGIQFETEE